MAVSEPYRAFVLEQLEGLGEISSRRMFGGVGIWYEGLFFAIIDDDVVYLKVDEAMGRDLQERGMRPFTYERGKSIVSMQYYEVPAEILEDADELKRWALRSIEVARGKSDS